VEDLFGPYPSFGFVLPSNKSSIHATYDSSVQQIVGPSDKSFVCPIDRSSVARARRRWRPSLSCAFLGRSVLSVCFVCLSRSWLLRLLPWITRSEVGEETSNSLICSISFVYQAVGAENRVEGSDGGLHHFHSPEEVDPLTARSGRLFQVLCPKVLILSMAISSYLLHPSNISERVYASKYLW
jgi:hypothetical protein